MNHNKRFIWTSLIIIIASIVLDQASKTFLIGHLKTRTDYIIEVLPFLDLVYAWNYGASFGIFRQYYQFSNYLLLATNTFIVAVLIYLLNKSKDWLDIIAFSMIIGGAIGNIIDRIIRGAVFDFIYFHYDNLYFPAFNIADSFITVGAVVYFYNYYFINSKKDLAGKSE